MTFRTRLTLIMAALLMISQIVIIVAVLGTAYIDALRRGHERLETGSATISQVLGNRAELLRNNATQLARDDAFRKAVLAQNQALIDTALAHSGTRIAADLTLVTDSNGHLIASNLADVATSLRMSLAPSWRKIVAQQDMSSVVMLQGKPYQLVMIPMADAGVPAWVGMGFQLDNALAKTLGAITHFDVSFVGHRSSYPPYIASTRTAGHQALLAVAAESSALAPRTAFTEQKRFLTYHDMLDSPSTGHVSVILQLPRTALMAPYERLKGQLTLILLVTLTATLLIVILAARRLSNPIRRLSDVARRIGQGERIEASAATGTGEIGLLARTLTLMQKDLAQSEKDLQRQARHDLLTGLPNRLSAELKVAELIEQQVPFILQRLCINNFRQINDTFGYAMGDQVLIEVGQRLRQLMHADHHVFRIGDDEYLLIYLLPTKTPEQRQEALAQLTATPVKAHEIAVTLSISVGSADYPEHGDNAQLLLRRSDIALDIARLSTQRFQAYTPGIDERHQRQLIIARDLSRALQDNQLHMVYQPKVNIATNTVYQFEALIRWKHETLGVISPEEFIVLAERLGSVGQLTDCVIRHVTHQLHEWAQQGEHLNVAINLSAHDFSNTALVRQLTQRMAHYALDHRQLSLEITESALMKDPAQATQLLNELRQSGFSIAIDDFGTGYSSLSQLRHLPIDELKVDQSFILRLDSQTEDAMIVRSIIDLGHNLGLKITAEGVENAASLALLKQMGCDMAQGYFLALPLKTEHVRPWLATYRTASSRPIGSEVPLPVRSE